MLTQKQNFMNNYVARVPITPKQQGTHEMTEEVLSSGRAQDLDSSGYDL